ncbi:hypothetical protein CPB83DRAFT_846941 [Crepidotus variabilis]|uniref:Zn(2)-C6 fungal-type domain-containing protein n=1 Tax=Crepidotus variabilis TaxID=179855 RepID=A0A9P6JU30_9AGAR|nr:hypothetical protein CPB83DRAFT_846941 [Crepidotus variabilis]
MPYDPFAKQAKRHLKAQPGEPRKHAKRRTTGPYSIESRRRRQNRSAGSSTTDSGSSQQGMFDSAQDVSVSGGTFNNLTGGSLVVNIHQQRSTSRAESSFADTSRSLQLNSLPQHGSVIQPTSYIKSESFDGPLTLPTRPRSNISDSRIYHDQLLLKGRGTPLWHPSPNRRLPKSYRREGINIGDVGTVNEFGAFCFLFNIFEEAGSEINGGLVPNGFRPLHWMTLTEREGNDADNVGVDLRDVEEQRVYDDGSWLGTGAIEEVVESGESGHSFRTRACEGAILTMPFGATSKDLVNRQLLQEYMTTNLEEWYIYANRKRGRQAQNGNIRLVYGCDKVSSWGIATFHHEQIAFGELSPERTLRFVPIKSEPRSTAGYLTKFAWGSLSGGSGRAGPTDQEIRDLVDQHERNTMAGLTSLLEESIENQCVFVRTLNAMLCKEDWERIMGGLSPDYGGSGSSYQQPHDGRGGNHHHGGYQGEEPRNNSSDLGSQSYNFGPASGIQYTSMEGQPMPLIHPSESLNQLLLRRFPRSRMVVTADADWLAVLETMQCIALQNMTSLDGPRFLKLGVHPLHFERLLTQSYKIVEDQGIVQLKKISSRPERRPSYRRRLKRHDSLFSTRGDLFVIVRDTAFRLHYRHIKKPLRSFISVYTLRNSRRRKILNGAFEDKFEDLLASYYQVSHIPAPQETIKKEDPPMGFSLTKSESQLSEPIRKSSPQQNTNLQTTKLPIMKLGNFLSEPQFIPLKLETWFDIALSIGMHNEAHQKKGEPENAFFASQLRAESSETAVTSPNTTGWPALASKSSACLYCKLLHKKCDFTPGRNTCKRCAKGGQVCIIVGNHNHKAPQPRNMHISNIPSQFSFASEPNEHQFAPQTLLFNAQPSSVSKVSPSFDTDEAGYRKPSSIYSLLTTNKRPRGEAVSYDPRTTLISLGQPGTTTKRLPGACTRCKNLKVKCTFASETGPCRRCFNGSHECLVLGRKRRSMPPKRETLLLQIRSQSHEIERLRKEIMKVRLGISAEHPYSEQERGPIIYRANRAVLYESDSNNSSSENVSKMAISEQYAVSYDHSVDVDENPASLGATPNQIQSVVFETEEGINYFDQHHDKSLTTLVTSASPSIFSGALRDEIQTDLAKKDSGMANTQLQWPTMFILSIVSPQEVEKLFNIYFTAINPSISLLDPNLCTVPRTLSRSPFLFTVVCAVASRLDSGRPDLYRHAMHYAQLAAGTALTHGEKNVEMCQAYLLLSLYYNSPRKTEEGSTWLYLGLAIRIATDLNLHLPDVIPPPNNMHSHELANRARVWLNCFTTDRSVGLQYGKPLMISSNDFNACHSENWWRSSPQEMRAADILLCANVAKWNLLDAFIVKVHPDSNHLGHTNPEPDLGAYACVADDEFQVIFVKWTNMLDVNSNMREPENSFRQVLLRLMFGHARLVALAYGFHRRSSRNHGVFPLLRRCLNATFDVVSAVGDIWTSSQNQYWEYGSESLPILVTFAAAFLGKVLQSSLIVMLSQEERAHMLEQAQAAIDLLDAPRTNSVKQSETEAYSRFLRELLEIPAKKSTSTPNPPHQKQTDILSFHSLSKAVIGLDRFSPSFL